MYGKLGVLERDGERVQCHICGRWYQHLGSHAWHKHGITADEYREEYQLNKGQALVSTELSQVLNEKCGIYLRKWMEEHPKEAKKNYLTPESALRGAKTKRRLQWINTFVNMQAKRIAAGTQGFQRQELRAKAIAKIKQAIKNGTHSLQRPEVIKKARERTKQLFKNGTHPLQRPEIRKKAIVILKQPEFRAKTSARQKQAFKNGTHPLQRPEVIKKRIAACKK